MAAVAHLTDQLDQANSEQDPASRVQKLRDLRADLAFLVGTADRYIGDAELEREGSTARDVLGQLNARADADARDRLVQNGMIAPEAADAAGLYSHQQLDRAEELGESWLLEAVRPPTRSRPSAGPEPAALHELAEAAEPAGHQPSTVDVYARTDEDGTRTYDKTRQELHRHISDRILRRSRRSNKPTAALIMGAAGREKLADDLDARGRLPADAAHIDHQQIKAGIPEFRHMLRDGDPQAHLAVHEEAHDIARQTLSEAVRRRANVVLSGTGGNAHEVAHALKRHGYRVEAHVASSSPLAAAKTMLDQASDPSEGPDRRRVIPPDRLNEAYRDQARGIRRAGDAADSLSVYDTDPTYSREVYRDGDILDDQAFGQAINPPALPPVPSSDDDRTTDDELADQPRQLSIDPEAS